MDIIDAGLKFRGARPDGGEQDSIDAIVLHHSDGYGAVEDVHAYHRDKRGYWGIGYHYYIRRDGTIYRGREEKFVGGHAGSKSDHNTHSIGICFEGRMDTTDFLTDEQIKSGRWLISDIKARYEIKEILKHSDLTATACPGKNFDINKMLSQTKYTVCLGEYGTKAEAVAVASVLNKWFDGVTIKQI